MGKCRDWATLLATTSVLLLSTPLTALAAFDGLGLGPAVGSERVYRVTFSGQAEIDYALLASTLTGPGHPGHSGAGAPSKQIDPQMQTVDYHLRAMLHWRVLERTSTGYSVVARLQAAQFDVNGSVDERVDLIGPWRLPCKRRTAW